jgi:NAD(P)H-hydrate epimerase
MKYQIFIKKDISHKNIFSFTLTPEKKILQNIFFNIPLNQNTYKKSFGKTLIIGGASGYLGAAIISGKSALYSGSRYVEIMTTKPHSMILSTHQPELITSYKISDFQKKIISYKNLLIGPGMSNDAWSKKIFIKIKKYLSSQPTKINCVIDGGFLSMLSKDPYKYDDWVMTPHIGEAAQLLKKKSSDIEADRSKAAKELQEKYGGIIILKGPKTIIQTKENSYICNHGNQGMGTAGMGDCLAGTVLSLVTLANTSDRVPSVLFATGIHSLAADIIKKETGDIGLLASQVIIKINELLNEIKVK